jgi:hypothetical protein
MVRTLKITLAETLGKSVRRSKSRISTTPLEISGLNRARAAWSMDGDTSTPTYRHCTPPRSIRGAMAAPSAQPRSTTDVWGRM